MRIGYPCINLSLSCRGSKTFRLKSYSEERMRETIENNLSCLWEILEFNDAHDILFFRITSDLIPFASHPVCTFPWRDAFRETFQRIGAYIRGHVMRVSLHPDQFILINSIREDIFQRSLQELIYQADVLDLLGLDESAKIQIHVGGLYGERTKSLQRFVERYKKLPKKITQRLVIENDDRLFDVQDCLDLHQATGIPVVFDVFHFLCLNRKERLNEVFPRVHRTWSAKDGILIADYSSQKPDARPGTHVHSIDMEDFRGFLRETNAYNFDIMLEIKNKERSALKALEVMREERAM